MIVLKFFNSNNKIYIDKNVSNVLRDRTLKDYIKLFFNILSHIVTFLCVVIGAIIIGFALSTYCFGGSFNISIDYPGILMPFIKNYVIPIMFFLF